MFPFTAVNTESIPYEEGIMKTSKFAVLACILVCAFMAVGFVDRASAAIKVTVTPAKAAVPLGGTQQFKAQVTGVPKERP